MASNIADETQVFLILLRAELIKKNMCNVHNQIELMHCNIPSHLEAQRMCPQ